MAGRQVRAVLFDKDGTLFDFDATWGAWAQSRLEQLARDPDHLVQMADAIGFQPSSQSFAPESPVIAGTLAQAAELLLPHLPGRTRDDLIAELEAAGADVPLVTPVPLMPLLQQLRASGLRLGICTNDSEATARVHLAEAGVLALFDRVIGYDSGHGWKPGPGPLLAFADGLELDPTEVVMIGDSLTDLRAARAAGMHALAVLSGPAGPEELAPEADAVLRDIGALPDWLEAFAREDADA